MGAQPAVAPSQAPAPVVARDVALGSGSTLTGRVIDGQAQPKQNVSVVLERNAQVVAEFASNAQGQFQFANLSEGVYGLHVNGVRQEVRVWNQATCPPTAVSVLQVPTGDIVRGQCTTGCTTVGGGCGGGGLLGGGGLFGGGGLGAGGLGGGGFLGGSALSLGLAAGIATAIIVPLALDDDDAS